MQCAIGEPGHQFVFLKLPPFRLLVLISLLFIDSSPCTQTDIDIDIDTWRASTSVRVSACSVEGPWVTYSWGQSTSSKLPYSTLVFVLQISMLQI